MHNNALQGNQMLPFVGFGPETTANSFTQSGLKVAQMLNSLGGFRAATFRRPFSFDELCAFDILAFIKILPDADLLARLKALGKVIILDYHDAFLTPVAHEQRALKRLLKAIYYRRLERRERLKYSFLNGCFTPTNEAARACSAVGIRPLPLFRQIYNDWNQSHPRLHTEATTGLTIIWTGTPGNIAQNKRVEPILSTLCERYKSQVVYLTQGNHAPRRFFEYRAWSLSTWENELCSADIAFRWWENSNDQRQKDSNKVLSFMAAGLFVVCKPTESDRMVLDHGRTGFFAETPDQFSRYISQLTEDALLRKRIGCAAHEHVWTHYSLEKHVLRMREHLVRLLEEVSGCS